MSIVIPAILPSSKQDLEDKLAQLAAIESVTAVQIDAVDGIFAAPACWPYSEPGALAALKELPYAGRFLYDADLMVMEGERAADRWSALGASRLTLHIETITSVPRAIEELRARHGHEPGFAPGLFELGLALSLGTRLARIEPYLAQVDYVQLMGIKTIGMQGQPFDKRVLAKIKELRTLAPQLTIQIDGAVTLETAPLLLAAGASRLVVGHALWQGESLAAQISKFEMLSSR